MTANKITKDEKKRYEFNGFVKDAVRKLSEKLISEAKKRGIAVHGHNNFIKNFSYLKKCEFDSELFDKCQSDQNVGLFMVACGVVGNSFSFKYFDEDYSVSDMMLVYNTITRDEAVEKVRQHNEDVINRQKKIAEEKEKNELSEYKRLKRKFEGRAKNLK